MAHKQSDSSVPLQLALPFPISVAVYSAADLLRRLHMHLLSGKGLLGLDRGIFPVRQLVITLHKALAA